jgi:hypothetical protein
MSINLGAEGVFHNNKSTHVAMMTSSMLSETAAMGRLIATINIHRF